MEALALDTACSAEDCILAMAELAEDTALETLLDAAAMDCEAWFEN
jgi:hypothetical protein